MELKTLYKLFKTHKEGSYVMESQNAVLLYQFVRKHPIKRVLDLGTGIGLSSAVCALAFLDKGEKEGHIDTVEQFDKCINLANELIPEELKPYITIHKSDVKVWQHSQIPHQFFSNYTALPEGDYDLIINDGPPYFMQNDVFVDLPNGTITENLDKIKAGTFVAWDGRLLALQLLERYFADNFEIYRTNQRGDDFNILRRLDTTTFRDDRLKIITDTGYFNGLYEKDNIPSDLTNPPPEATATS